MSGFVIVIETNVRKNGKNISRKKKPFICLTKSYLNKEISAFTITVLSLYLMYTVYIE